MKALIDADVLTYEIGSCGQYYEPEDVNKEHLIIREFDYVSGLLDQRIKEICGEAWADEPPTLFLTGDDHLLKHTNRERKQEGLEIVQFKPNFRVATAKARAYKGKRVKEKPYHYHNLRAYMLGTYDCVISDGLEADDVICINLYKSFTTRQHNLVACTRDKDLRQVPGLHYGWPCGLQPAFPTTMVDELGFLELSSDRKKIRGVGLKFFFAQLITGDVVDNIPGLPRGGPVLAGERLSECRNEAELFDVVAKLYQERCGETWREYLREQIDLLWMVRELNEQGEPVYYVMPDERP